MSLLSCRALTAGLALACTLFTASVKSAEYLRSESTAPTSLDQVQTPLDAALKEDKKPQQSTRLGRFNRHIENTPKWLSDASLDFKLRTYDFKRINQNDSINQASALGGEIGMLSGKFAGFARLGLSYYYSGALSAPEDSGNTGLLTSDQQNLSVLGKAYLLLGDEKKIAARLYRQTLDLPYVNKHDSRMVPATYEAYLLGRKSSGRDFVLGHITKMKKQNSNQFEPMSVLAGALNSNQGLSIAGIKGDFSNNASLGVFNYYGWDTYSTSYVESNWLSPFLRKFDLSSSIQYTDQRSVGEALIGRFSTHSAGFTVSGGRDGRLLELAYTQNAKGGLIRSPWGGSALYNSMMLQNFNRAGEKAIHLGVSLASAHGRFKSWSGFANITAGWDAINSSTGTELPNLIEYDITLDYKPQSKPALNGFWLRLRGAYADFDDDTRRWNIRFILNYPFKLL